MIAAVNLAGYTYIPYILKSYYRREVCNLWDLGRKGIGGRRVYRYICVDVEECLRSKNTYPFLGGQPLPSMDLN